MQEIPGKLYERLGVTNRLKLGIKGNNTNMRTIRNPNLKYQPAALSPFLYSLELDGDVEMSCTCDAGYDIAKSL